MITTTASQKSKKSRYISILMGITALVGVSALAAPAQSQGKNAETIIYGNTAGPGTLDPFVGSSTVDLEVMHHIFEGLVGMDANY
ncbi:hypothetical protein ABTM60_19155, partial [Acinetobacter baumannii]